MIICYKNQLDYQNESNANSSFTPVDVILYSNCQEDLACILFTMLYHQVSCLDYYYSNVGSNKTLKFDISSNLKTFIQTPFNLSELGFEQHYQQFEIKGLKEQQHRVYDLNYKLADLCHKIEQSRQENLSVNQTTTSLKEIIEDKIRLRWNFNWHGGSLLKLCHDLLNNQMLIQNESFSKYLIYVLFYLCFSLLLMKIFN